MSSIQRIKQHYSLFFPIILFWIIFLVLFNSCLSSTNGHFTYTLDDTYIHMSMAQNFLETGIFGINEYEFSSTSSSPIWTLLIALLFGIFGINVLIPLVLNLVFSTLIVIFTYHMLLRWKIPAFYRLLSLTALMFFTSLPNLVFNGMEHSFHILVVLIFIHLSSQLLSEEQTDQSLAYTIIITSLLASLRFEAILMIGVVLLCLLIQKKPKHVLLVGIAAALPWVVYGLFSLSQGGFLLPNSILLKGLSGVQDSFVSRGITTLYDTQHILVLLIISTGLLYMKRNEGWERENIISMIFIFSSILHLQIASTGWFYRYEAYLVATGVFVISLQLVDYLPDLNLSLISKPKATFVTLKNHFVLFMLIGLCILPLGIRGISSTNAVPIASTNIYEQQYQMARFLGLFYSNESVLIHDIGYVSFISDVQCIDIMGLGSVDFAQSRLDGTINPETVTQIAQKYNVKIAVLPLSDLSLVNWSIVGQWTISNNLVCGSDTITFLAVNPTEAALLLNNLVQFSPSLPSSVIQSGIYTEVL